jgi:regulator of cell morphogenesis and NO signaling
MTDVHDAITLGDLVASNPGAARVLDGFGLDYCCHGARTLDQACADAGVDTPTVVAALAGIEVEGDTSWTALDAPALAHHIVDTHHRYLWEELPLVEALATKVVGVHGQRHPELAEVHELVAELRADLEPHLQKEERVLFPAALRLAEV